MDHFWAGFVKQAGLLKATSSFIQKAGPGARAGFRDLKYKNPGATVWDRKPPGLMDKATNALGTAKREVMKTPGRALATGLAAGAGATYAATRQPNTPGY
jgi:hypothetical protein